MTSLDNSRLLPRHRRDGVDETPRPDRGLVPNRTAPGRPRWTADEQDSIDKSEHLHLRGIPVVGLGGVSPNTRPGRGFCTECAAKSGQWHKRACSWEGSLP
jgi:hypothetical protein